jgi:Flp pilus assembly protein TadD
MRQGDPAGAAAELDAFLKQKPDHADAQLALGTLYFVQHRYEQALLHLQRAARLKPEDAEIRDWLARTQAALAGKP